MIFKKPMKGYNKGMENSKMLFLRNGYLVMVPFAFHGHISLTRVLWQVVSYFCLISKKVGLGKSQFIMG